jgi:hypothetical protein
MPSAWNSDEGKFYTIQEYCGRYNIDFTSVSSYKLVSHNAGHMVYNIAMRAIHTQDEINAFEELEKALKEVGKNVSYKQKEVCKNVNGLACVRLQTFILVLWLKREDKPGIQSGNSLQIL